MTARPAHLRAVPAPDSTVLGQDVDVYRLRRQVAELSTQIAVQQHRLQELAASLQGLYVALGRSIHPSGRGWV